MVRVLTVIIFAFHILSLKLWRDSSLGRRQSQQVSCVPRDSGCGWADLTFRPPADDPFGHGEVYRPAGPHEAGRGFVYLTRR